MFKTAVVIALVAVVALRLHFFYYALDFHKTAAELEPTPNFQSCQHIVSTVSFSPNTAPLLLKEIPGYEDIALIDQQTAVSCAGDLHNLWHQSAFKSKGSQCVLLRLDRSVDHDGATVIAVEALSITGFQMYSAERSGATSDGKKENSDEEMKRLLSKNIQQVEKLEDTKLHLHGLTIVKDPRQGTIFYLFGINHAYDRGDERVEVFRIDQERRQLHHMFSIKFDNQTTSLYRGTLNDLVVADFATQPHGMKMSGSIYVSSWLELADPVTGRVDGPDTTSLFLKRKVLMYGRGILGNFNTKLIRCSFDTTELFAQKCEFRKELVARCDNNYLGGFGIANGMASVALSNVVGVGKRPVEVVFAADVILHQIKIFLSPPWEAFSNLPFQNVLPAAMLSVNLPHAIDNIEAVVDDVQCENQYDSAGPEKRSSADEVAIFRCTIGLYSGFIATLKEASKIDVGMSNVISPGGLGYHKIHLVVEQAKASQLPILRSATVTSDQVIVMTDGRFNGLSSGVILRDGEAAYAVMSSFKEVGFLACPLTG